MPPSVRCRFAILIGLARRFWLLILLIGLPLGLFVHQKHVTMRSDWVLMRANSVIVSVRRNLHSARQNLNADSSESVGWKYDYYKLNGTEKAEFIAQLRQRTFGLSERTYAGIYPFWVYTLDANGLCDGRILVQGTEGGHPEQWEAIYDSAIKGERVDEEAKNRQTVNSVFLVR
jgi:hypothetical protein